jgi:hypothetical protein
MEYLHAVLCTDERFMKSGKKMYAQIRGGGERFYSGNSLRRSARCVEGKGQFVTAKTVNKPSYSDVSHVKVGKWLTATG